ncbi:hypothetical protein EVAR_81961_1 [Eumeta japonica]|uniref:Uncharacterized protein n=1 Tax=Eumeta variegata TaxID=151549 RepID=A0A4C1VUT6_EUMVA|nr:hypothetical protein EVAR_81961_1 [Eumeta japonica]
MLPMCLNAKTSIHCRTSSKEANNLVRAVRAKTCCEVCTSDETAHSALPVRSTKDQWARPLIQLLRDLFLWRSRSALSPQSRAGRARGIRASFIIQPLYRLTNFRMQLCPR